MDVKFYNLLWLEYYNECYRGLTVPVLAKTRIGKYFRTTVPREVRKILEVSENDEIEWILNNGVIIVKKAEVVNTEIRGDRRCKTGSR